MSIAIEVKNLSLSYDMAEGKSDIERHWIFKDLNFQIKAGEFVLLTGPSGCGKSSLMNIINGVIANLKDVYIRGDVYIQEQQMTGCSVQERTAFVGSVFQNAREQIIFDKVRDEIVFPMENIGETPQKMRDNLNTLLEMTGLLPDAQTASLSGGEKQKLMTACTLAMGQNVLLLDEPLANMDRRSATQLLTLLKQLSENENYTIVVIEHRQELVLPHADKVFSCIKSPLPNVNMELKIYENKRDYQPYVYSHIHKKEKMIADLDETIFFVKDIDYCIGERFLFKHFSWEIKKGEKWVIVGDNGCGKTTMLRLLYGFEKPTSGHITSPYTKIEKRKIIGYILQNPDYQLFMPRVKDELYLHSKSPEFVEELIRLFEFEDMLERHPLSLSEGQKRKLGVACVIANEPSILFLDEPTVGLDSESIEQLFYSLALLKKRTRGDLTTISVSHDKRAIPYLGNKILNLNHIEV